MTQKLNHIFEELLNAPLRILEWQIISRNPELYSDEGLEWLKKERERAWERKDYKRIEKLSSKILLFERCRDVGGETAFWGRKLGEEQRNAVEAAIPQEVIQNYKKAEELKIDGKWEEAIEILGNLLKKLDITNQKILFAVIQSKLGDILLRSPKGDRAENLERAIEVDNKALEVITYESFPECWVMIHHNLAVAYMKRIRGDRTENLEKVIKLTKKALDVCNRESFPIYWAGIKNIMATAFQIRIIGDRAQNLEKAIELYNKALEVRTYEAFPIDWAKTLTNMANNFIGRIIGNRAENIEKSIELFNYVLVVWTYESFPEDWAMIQNNLADAYRSRIRGDRAENLENAIKLSKNALAVFTCKSHPEYWAHTQNHIANEYLFRIRGDRAENLEKAIELYSKTLEVYTYEAYPEDWALTHNNLANAYLYRILGDKAENLEKAIKLYNNALKVCTRKSYPIYWAKCLDNVAVTYYSRIQGDRAENLEKAIELYNRVLEVKIREIDPESWAVTQNNMADAYYDRICGDRAENIENAIVLYNKALDVRVLEDFPEEWAMIQNNLAFTYCIRILGDRVQNFEHAIELFNKALEVRTPETFPGECRQAATGLTEAQIYLKRWEDALKSAQLARQADRILQRQATSLSGKTHVIEEGATLYYLASYACAHLNDVIGAVEWLEQGKTRELGDALEKDRAIMQGERYVKILERLKVLDAEQRGAVPGARPFIEVAEDARRVHAELEELIKSIQIYKPDFLKETTISREEIRSILTDETEAYIVFNVTTCGSAIMLLTRLEDQPIAETLFFDDFNVVKLNALVKMWSENLAELKSGGALSTAGHKHFREQIDIIGRKIYDALFTSVYTWLQEHGKNIKKLIFIPHLSLHILPLHLIKYDVDNKPRYLIEEYDISYAPSISVILKQQGIKREIRSAASISKDALIVSNPTGDLQFAQEEAGRIQRFFPQKKNILEGRHATADNLIKKASGSRFLHLSCHGEFDPVEPWNSGIVLASEENLEIDMSRSSGQVETVCMHDGEGKVVQELRSYKEHGEERINFDAKGNVLSRVRSLPDGKSYLQGKGRLFTLKEVFTNIDLTKTEMVVLSACETSLVSIKGKSDEFVGLAGGFIRAGAKNVVASLWVVDDHATTELMEKFYTYLFEQNLEPSKALRQAQLDIKHEQHWKNPFYWGAFRVLGS